MNLLFLTYRMSQGFGVDVVVANLTRELQLLGHKVLIGVIEKDDTYLDLAVHIVRADSHVIEQFCDHHAIHVVVAHTPPYFELLPALSRPTILWDHGEPDWQFFGESEQPARRRVIEEKRQIYPKVTKVVTISEFLKTELKVPDAKVIYNGCDHAKVFPAKTNREKGPLRIGTLMRMGRGEALYKGNAIFRQLISELQGYIPVVPCVMGKGTAEDAKEFKGYEIHLNSTDDEKWNYLHSLDVFVSCSLWEGFNLPLVEAQRCGTLSLAFDTGAHPEVCPFVFNTIVEMIYFIRQMNEKRELLVRYSNLSQDFVTTHFVWKTSSLRLSEFLADWSSPNHETK